MEYHRYINLDYFYIDYFNPDYFYFDYFSIDFLNVVYFYIDYFNVDFFYIDYFYIDYLIIYIPQDLQRDVPRCLGHGPSTSQGGGLRLRHGEIFWC